MLVEHLEDVRKAIEFGLRRPAAGDRNGLDLGIRIGKLNVLRGTLLNPVTVHIDRFEYASREIVFHRVKLRRRLTLKTHLHSQA